jgi:glycosyltransferase involved in cell wall biosynthesis
MIRGVADAAKIIDINLNIVAVTTSDISNITNSIDEISYLKSINVFSKISDEEIVKLYTNSDLSVFCTLAEGFGIPIAESGWLNVPIVASNVGTIKEVAELFAEAILVDPRNHLDISNGIVRAIKYKGFNKIGALSRRTWNQVSQELLNSIE